ncbi:MAG TPA: HupE/UreJ family protein [Polyangia bacterium]
MAGIVALALVLAFAPNASAHAPTFAVYSKYEATVSGRRIAFVFALDRPSVLQLIQRDVTHTPVDVATVDQHRAFFSQFLFARFSVSNDGASCAHPPELGRFFWDEPTKRVVAVTSFGCSGDLNQLTIRSTVTHDMPTAHELVGDLLYDDVQTRSTFANDDVEAHLSLSALASGGDKAVAPRRRGKFSFVGVPDRERRYDDLARAELGGDALTAARVPVGRLEAVLYFIGQGILHIFTGYDHVLFIITLVLVVATWRRLAVIITSFTLAHSMTLAAGALGWVVLPSRIIEPAIALTVLAVAADALARPRGSARAWVTFVFGLIHGFGLSSALRTMGLSGGALLRALFGFNVGVELGQLLIVLPLFPLVLRLRAHEALYLRVRRAVCTVVAAVAVVWFILRVVGRGASS